MKLKLLLLSFMTVFSTFADSSIEQWKNSKDLRYVVRDSDGRFEGLGFIELESWNDSDEVSEWVVRRKDGTFVTNLTGRLEKFKVKGLKKQQKRLVFRNTDGQFVTWISLDQSLTEGFERFDYDHDGQKETVYVLRYHGRIVNWSVAALEDWKGHDYPVLVARDTSDGKANGQILAIAYAQVLPSGQVVYRHPRTGKFLGQN